MQREMRFIYIIKIYSKHIKIPLNMRDMSQIKLQINALNNYMKMYKDL